MSRNDGIGLLGIGIAIFGAAFGLSQCGKAQQEAGVQKLRVCLENGGQEDTYGRCVVPGREEQKK